MIKVTIKDITHGYPVENSIVEVRCFTGKVCGDVFDEANYEYRPTGAKILNRTYAENKDGGDTITFEIDNADAEKYLEKILTGWDNYIIEEVV